MKNNYFEFNNAFYKQLKGTDIGTKCASPYAILFSSPVGKSPPSAGRR